MKSAAKKPRRFLQRAVAILLPFGLGIVLGLVSAGCFDRLSSVLFRGKVYAVFPALILSLFLAFLLQIILHETGHLVFGLMTGYRFSSFRIFRWMLLKTEAGLRWKRLSLTGTAGQCLMIPPRMKNGTVPVIAYNLGGVCLNLITAALFYGLSKLLPRNSFLSVFLLLLAFAGLGSGLLNGIPMHTAAVSNDGYNALSLGKDPAALSAFWCQMTVNAMNAAGVRLRDMPEELFSMPPDDAMKNSMIAAQGVLAVSRMVDEHRFDRADAAAEHLLSLNSGMAGLHRSLLLCERICYELTHENRAGVLDTLLIGQQPFFRSMKSFPTVLRTQYLLQLLRDRDPKKAAETRKKFESVARSYPYPCDIVLERELMELGDACAASLNTL